MRQDQERDENRPSANPIVESEWSDPIIESEWSEPIVESEWTEPSPEKKSPIGSSTQGLQGLGGSSGGNLPSPLSASATPPETPFIGAGRLESIKESTEPKPAPKKGLVVPNEPISGLGGITQSKEGDWEETKLSPQEEQQFRDFMTNDPNVVAWAEEFKRNYGEYPSIEGGGYDYRGAFKSGQKPVPVETENGTEYHWGSIGEMGKELKSPDHPTRWKSDYMQLTGKNPDEEGISEARGVAAVRAANLVNNVIEKALNPPADPGTYFIDGKQVPKGKARQYIDDRSFSQAWLDGNHTVDIQGDDDFKYYAEKQKQSLTDPDWYDSIIAGIFDVKKNAIGLASWANDITSELTGIPNFMEVMATASTQRNQVGTLKENLAKSFEEIEFIEDNLFKVNGEITDLISDENWGEAGRMMVNTALRSSPNSIVMAGAGAVAGTGLLASAALTSPLFMGGAYADQEKEVEDINKLGLKSNIENLSKFNRMVTRPVLYGGAEAAGQVIEVGILKSSGKIMVGALGSLVKKTAATVGTEAAKNVAQEGAAQIWKNLAISAGINPLLEATSEVGTYTMQELTDIALGVSNKTPERIVNEAVNTFILGWGAGQTMSSPATAATVVSAANQARKKLLDYTIAFDPKGVDDLNAAAQQYAQRTGQSEETIKENIAKRAKAVNAVPKEKVSETETVDLVQKKQDLTESMKGLDPVYQEPIKEEINDIDDQLRSGVKKEYPAPRVFSTPTDKRYAEVNRGDGKNVELSKEEYIEEMERRGTPVEIPAEGTSEKANKETPAQKEKDAITKKMESEILASNESYEMRAPLPLPASIPYTPNNEKKWFEDQAKEVKKEKAEAEAAIRKKYDAELQKVDEKVSQSNKQTQAEPAKEVETEVVSESELNKPKTIKELESENKATAPKVKTDKVFLNASTPLNREETKGVDKVIKDEAESSLPIESISVEQIVPTQKNLTIPNLEKTKGVTDSNEEILLVEKDGKFYVIDGHHRIANRILDGDKAIEARVFREPVQEPAIGNTEGRSREEMLTEYSKLAEEFERLADDFEFGEAMKVKAQMDELAALIPEETFAESEPMSEEELNARDDVRKQEEAARKGTSFEEIQASFSPISIAHYEREMGKGMYKENKRYLTGLVTAKAAESIDTRGKERKQMEDVEYFDPEDIIKFINTVASERAEKGFTEYKIPKERKFKEKVKKEPSLAGKKVSTGDFLRDLAKKVGEGKMGNDVAMSSFPGFKQAFNAAVTAAEKALEGTAYVSDIIDYIIEHVRNSPQFKNLRPAQRKAFNLKGTVLSEMGMDNDAYNEIQIKDIKAKAKKSQTEAVKETRKEEKAKAEKKAEETKSEEKAKTEKAKERAEKSKAKAVSAAIEKAKQKYVNIGARIGEAFGKAEGEVVGMEKGLKQAAQMQKWFAKQVNTLLEDMISEAKEISPDFTVTPKQLKAITKKLLAVNPFSKSSFANAVEYMEKVLEDAAYLDKMDKVRDMQKAVRKRKHPAFQSAVNQFLSIRPEQLPDDLVAPYMEALGDMSKPVPSYRKMQDMFFDVTQHLPNKRKPFKAIEEIDAVEKLFNRILEREAEATTVEDYLKLLKDIRKWRAMAERVIALESDQGVIDEMEQFVEDIDAIQERFEKKYADEIADMKAIRIDHILDRMKELDPFKNPSGYNDLNLSEEAKTVLKELADLGKQGMEQLTFEEITTLGDVLDLVQQDGYTDLSRLVPIVAKATARLSAPEIAKQVMAAPELKDVKGMQADLARSDMSFREGLMGFGRRKYGAFHTRVIAPMLRAASEHLNFINSGRKFFNDKKKEYKLKEENLDRIGMFMFYLREHALSFDPKYQDKTDAKGGKYGFRDWFSQILENNKEDYGITATDEVKRKVGTQLLGRKNKYYRMKDAFDSFPKDKDGKVDVQAAYEAFKDGSTTFLSKNEMDFLKDVIKWDNENTLGKQRAANEMRGKPFDEIMFHIHRKRTPKLKATEVEAPQVVLTGKNRVKVASDSGQAVTSEKIEPIEFNFEELFDTNLNETSRDYFYTPALMRFNATLKEVKKLLPEKKQKLMDIAAWDMQESLNHDLSYSNINPIVKNILKAQAMSTFIDPIRTAIEMVSSFTSYPFRARISPLRAAKSMMVSNDMVKDLLRFTSSPLMNKESLQKHFEVEKGTIKEKGKLEKLTYAMAGAPELVLLKPIWYGRFYEEFFNRTGQKFEPSKFSDPEYKQEHRQEIMDSAAAADGEYTKISGSPTGLGGKRKARIAPRMIAKAFQQKSGDIDVKTNMGMLTTFMTGYTSRDFQQIGESAKSMLETYRASDGKWSDYGWALGIPFGSIAGGFVYAYLNQVRYVTERLLAPSDDEEEEEARKELETLTTLNGAAAEVASSFTALAATRYHGLGRQFIKAFGSIWFNMAESEEDKAYVKSIVRNVTYQNPYNMEQYGNSKANMALSLAEAIPLASIIINNASNVLRQWKDVDPIFEKISNGEPLTEPERDKALLIKFTIAMGNATAQFAGYNFPSRSVNRTIDKYVSEVADPIRDVQENETKIESAKETEIDSLLNTIPKEKSDSLISEMDVATILDINKLIAFDERFGDDPISEIRDRHNLNALKATEAEGLYEIAVSKNGKAIESGPKIAENYYKAYPDKTAIAEKDLKKLQTILSPEKFENMMEKFNAIQEAKSQPK